MDLLKTDVKKLYFKYLASSFGSVMMSTIYSTVDMAMVGQYHGPDGAAALAVIAPFWNIVCSLGLLTGIGGSILFSTCRGAGSHRDENQYFTVSAIGSVALALPVWLIFIFAEHGVLSFFGADESLFELAHRYLLPLKFILPLILFNQMLAAFLRNDGDPSRAAAGVLVGGIFNVFGDYFFVFIMDMGIFGAGLATAIGTTMTSAVMLTHFFSAKNTLKLVKTTKFISRLKEVVTAGFSTFFIDLAMGILTVLFNRQVMKLLGSEALSIYGVIINVSTFVQCCAYSVGQAAQPIISTGFGAKRWDRISETLKYALLSCAGFSLVWTGLSMVCPNLYIRIFMSPTESILAAAPPIIRCYALSFMLLPLNVFSTYYFQAVMRPSTAVIVSVARGCVISGALILLLPLVAGADALWFAMPITEAITAVYVIAKIREYSNKMKA